MSEFEYISDNIIVGNAELPAVRTAQGICWVLPGKQLECNRDIAQAYAEKLNDIISGNMRKYSRRLFRR